MFELFKGCDNEADVNINDKYGSNNLHYAYNCDEELIELIINKGVDVNKVNNQKKSPIIVAAICSDYTLVNLLLKHGAEINQQDQFF